MKLTTRWYSDRLQSNITVARYGHFGTPVLLFPTAGGDAEESERFQMMRALGSLLEAGRIKVYSCDSLAGRCWIDGQSSGVHRAWLQNRFDSFVYNELVPAIRMDCKDPRIEVVAAGASIGAFNALASICRHPDAFKAAICLSGTYDLTRWMNGQHTMDFHFSSPLHFLPSLGEGPHLATLRRRFIVFGTGEGRWEAPHESWQAAHTLGARRIPNRVDLWGKHYDHDWTTWREKLPQYLAHV